MSGPVQPAQSKAVNIDDGLGKSRRGFLGLIVSDAILADPVRVFVREFLRRGTGIWVEYAITIAAAVVYPFEHLKQFDRFHKLEDF